MSEGNLTRCYACGASILSNSERCLSCGALQRPGNHQGSPLNPSDSHPKGSALGLLLKMMIRPRQTISAIINSHFENLNWALAAAMGISNALDRALVRHSLESFPQLLLVLVGGSLSGIMTLGIWTALLSRTGRWLGGTASHKSILSAFAWSQMPVICMGVLLGLRALILGTGSLHRGVPVWNPGPLLEYGFLFFSIGMWLWTFVIFVQALREVQSFSVMRAIANVLLAAVSFLVLIGAVVVALLFTWR